MAENSFVVERIEEIARNRSLVALRAPVDRPPVIDCVAVKQPMLDRAAVPHVPLVGALQEIPGSSNRDICFEGLHMEGIAAYQSAEDLTCGVFRALEMVV
jgi:hypothetical protein